MLIKKNQKVNIIFLISFFAFFVFNFLLVSNVIAGEGVSKALEGLTAATNEGFGKNHSLETDVSTAIGKVVGAGLAFIGILFLILIIYGGFTWMLARGNEQEVEKAINIITQSSIGLIIVSAAYLITKFIGDNII